jgi:YidC/Oxa1 family membrane protein insertase
MKKQSKRFWLNDFFVSWAQYRAIKRIPDNRRSIFFYSESGQDWHHFSPIIGYLTRNLSKTVCYVTSDPTDPGLSQNNENLLSFYIRAGYWQIFFFQFVKADVMVLTMIDLNVFQLKRSIYPLHYIYIFHAMGSTHMVDFENSYDHYDSIFCVGPHQIREIRKREELEHLPAKHLFRHGYARIEQLMDQAARYTKKESAKPCVLLAPTWGDHSILHLCGKDLIQILLNAGFRVIVRPHYQTIKLSPGLIIEIVSMFGAHPEFFFVKSMGDTDSLFSSDILICDWSSTSIEYAIGLEKPVLYIDVPRRIRNPNYEALGIEPLEITIRDKVGVIIKPEEISSAPEKIRELLRQPHQFREKIAALRNDIVFNLGKSVEAGACEIVCIAEKAAGKR